MSASSIERPQHGPAAQVLALPIPTPQESREPTGCVMSRLSASGPHQSSLRRRLRPRDNAATLLRGARACLALLAAAALLALAAPAQAQTEVWTATLTPGDLTSGIRGCSNGVGAARCSSTSFLSEDSFNYDSTDYNITGLFVRPGGQLEFLVDADLTTNTVADLTLVVGSTSLVLSGGARSGTVKLIFASSGVSLTVGTDIAVKLTAPLPGTPATGAPTITGTAQVHQTLTAVATGFMDADGLTSPTYTYQWIRVNGTDADISGAMSSTYTLVAADVGKKVKVKVSFDDDDGNAETLTSAAFPENGTITDPNAAPVLTGVTVTSTPHKTTDTYGAREHIEFSAAFDVPVTVTGAPTFSFVIDTTTKTATWYAGSGTDTLRFSYSVGGGSSGDLDTDGISWAANALALNGGTIARTGSGGAATLTHGAQPALSGHKVNGRTSPVTPATITDVAVTSVPRSTASGSTTRDTYGLGETIVITVTVSESVTVEGDPEFLFSLTNMGGAANDVPAMYDRARSSSRAIAFVYTVLAGDRDNNGIWIGNNTRTFRLDVNDRIRTTSRNIDIDRSHSEESTQSGHKVDGSRTPGMATAPPDPTPPLLVSATTTTLTVEWTHPGDGGSPLVRDYVHYRVQGADWTNWYAGETPVTRAVITNLQADTAYQVQVHSTNAVGNSSWVQSATAFRTRANTPATGAPTITGTAQVDKTLTAVTTGIMDADGLTSPTYTYQWIRLNGTEADISGANSSTYILVDADLGKTLKVQVTFADDEGNPETLTSAATVTVAAATTPPEVVRVTVDSVGSNVVLVFDEGLDRTAGEALLFSVFSLTAAGQALTIGDHTIQGTALVLTVQLGTIKQGQTVVVSYTDPTAGDDTVALQDVAGNDVASFTTGQSGVPAVTNNSTNNAATGEPAITGTAQAGQELTAVTTGIMDTDGLTGVDFTYQWVRVDADGTPNPVDITDATAETYTLTNDDVGKKVKVKVSFTDDLSGPEMRTSAAYPSSGTVTVASPTAPFTGTWAADAYTADEGESVTVTATLRTAAGEPTPSESYRIRMVTGSDSATVVDDYTHVSTNLTVTPSAWMVDGAMFTVTVAVTVETVEDSVLEGDERFYVVLSGVDGEAQPGLECTDALRDVVSGVPGCATVVTIADDETLSVTEVTVSSTPAAGETYLAGEAIEFTVGFIASVTVTGTPTFAFTLGSAVRQATYASGSETAALVFSYTVLAGDLDRDGISWEADALALAGGTIRLTTDDANIMEDAALAHAGEDAQTMHRVDAVAPSLVSATVEDTTLKLVYDEALDEGSVPAASAYTVAVTVGTTTTNPTVTVTVGGRTVTLTLSASPADGATVTVSYTVPTGTGAMPVRDAAGNDAPTFSGQEVSVGAPLRLMGGTGDHEGRLEIRYEGQWGTVCDDYWTDVEADVACRALGYPNGSVGGGGLVHFGPGSGSILLDDVNCVGNETSLLACDYRGKPTVSVDNNNCSHSEDVGVRC